MPEKSSEELMREHKAQQHQARKDLFKQVSQANNAEDHQAAINPLLVE
jgi:hypothetical protein